MKAEYEVDKLLSGKYRRDTVEVSTNLLRKLKTQNQRLKNRIKRCKLDLDNCSQLLHIANDILQNIQLEFDNKSSDSSYKELSKMENE